MSVDNKSPIETMTDKELAEYKRLLKDNLNKGAK
jgi:hypothetical protein